MKTGHVSWEVCVFSCNWRELERTGKYRTQIRKQNENPGFRRNITAENPNNLTHRWFRNSEFFDRRWLLPMLTNWSLKQIKCEVSTCIFFLNLFISLRVISKICLFGEFCFINLQDKTQFDEMECWLEECNSFVWTGGYDYALTSFFFFFFEFC